jgi:PAS domain S-box-containing protein
LRLIVFILAGEIVAVILMALWIVVRRRGAVATGLVWLFATSACYLLGQLLSLLGGSPAYIERVLMLKYMGVCFMPPVVGFLFVGLLGWDHHHPRRERIALLGLAAVLVLLNVTNRYHGWFHGGIVTEQYGHATINTLRPGPGYVLHKLWLAGVIVFGLLVSAIAWRDAAAMHRRQILFLLMALVVPWGGNLLYHAGVRPFGPMDYSPFLLVPMLGLLCWSVFREQFARVMPVARGLVVEELATGVIVTDPNRMVVDVNPSARRMLDVVRSRGTPSLHDILSAYPVSRERCCRDEEGVWEEQSGDGGLYCSMTWKAIQSSHGRRLGYMLIISDVSQIKRADVALRESETKYRMLLEHSSDLIWELDTQGRFTYVSPSWERVIGYTVCDTVGTSFEPLIHPDDLEACRHYLAAMIGEKRPMASPEYRVRHLDGSWHWHAANARPVLDSLGRYVSMVGVSRDVTARKQVEEERETLLKTRTEAWREATAAALAASEEEARRIGYELHDTLCQDLIGLARQADSLTASLPVTPGAAIPATEKLREIAGKAFAAARRARELSHRLALPEPIEMEADEALAGNLCQLERLYDITCELTLDPAFAALSAGTATHVIRIVREAVVNAVRHSTARRIWVDGVVRGGQKKLFISSDGVSTADPASWKAGLGLRQMRMRAAMLGAALDFRRQGQGVIVELSIPEEKAG